MRGQGVRGYEVMGYGVRGMGKGVRDDGSMEALTNRDDRRGHLNL